MAPVAGDGAAASGLPLRASQWRGEQPGRSRGEHGVRCGQARRAGDLVAHPGGGEVAWTLPQEAQKNTIRFRFLTDHRWITGRITAVHSRLVDVLNTEGIRVLSAEEVEVQSSRQDVAAGGQIGLAEINVANIMLAVPVEDADGPPGRRDPMVWVKKRPAWARVGIGPYEIGGQAYVAEGGVVPDLFSIARDRFIPMTDATLKRIDDPAFEIRLDVVLVNRALIDYVMAV